jgi:hypothetical protein
MRMGIEQPLQPASGPLVEWFAGRVIRDPVVRLRFLRAVAPLPDLPPNPPPDPPPDPPAPPKLGRVIRPLLLLLLPLAVLVSFFLMRAAARVEPAGPLMRRFEPAAGPQAGRPSEVWEVENSGAAETYSNGLRIDNHFAVSNHRRSYRAFPVDLPEGDAGPLRSEPVGIVFHTTESLQAPFEARQNGVLKRIGESLLEYVRRKQAYNFLIDRFGRVFRVVIENDAANHAGYSVWSDEKWVYLNLNESFLGVSFEAQSPPAQSQAKITPAQVRAAAMLTEMLRGRYGILAANCVTHAQVSVNPSNMRMGYHTDWASSFPFAQLGLPDNYARASPALWAFGFECDPGSPHLAETGVYRGVELAEKTLLENAAEFGMAPAAYRKMLQNRYRKRLAEVRRSYAGEGDGSE